MLICNSRQADMVCDVGHTLQAHAHAHAHAHTHTHTLAHAHAHAHTHTHARANMRTNTGCHLYSPRLDTYRSNLGTSIKLVQHTFTLSAHRHTLGAHVRGNLQAIMS